MFSVGSGLMEAVKRLLATGTSVVATRLELLANELHEERLRLTQMLFQGLIALFCFGVGIILLTAFIIVLFWDSYRLAVLGVLCSCFFITGVMVALSVRNLAQQRPKLFTASLAELAKDRKKLQGDNE